MQDRQVERIEGLSLDFYATDAVVQFQFSGPHDAVRLAVRDLCYGLTHYHSIRAQLEFVSEIAKLNHTHDSEDIEIINVIVKTSEFNCLVLLFRYWMQLGFPLPNLEEQFQSYATINLHIRWSYCAIQSAESDDESTEDTSDSNDHCVLDTGLSTTLLDHLEAVIEYANGDHTPLIIKPYPLTFNRSLWLREEIQNDLTPHFIDKSNQLKLFSHSQSHQKILKHHLHHLIQEAENIAEIVTHLIMHNPLHHASFSDTLSLAKQYLDHYHQTQSDDIYTESTHSFRLIRPDQFEYFIELAEKYVVLMQHIHETQENYRAKKHSKCSIS